MPLIFLKLNHAGLLAFWGLFQPGDLWKADFKWATASSSDAALAFQHPAPG